MSSHPTWFVGNQQPSITETITSGGTPVDLTGATVKFKMRAVGSDVLKVDTTATPVSAADGTVRYDWATGDVDTEGLYLAWWEVTAGGKTQDLAEALIEFRAHGPGILPAYVDVEELKKSLELDNLTFADGDLVRSARAASRVFEHEVSRRFYLDADATSERYYSPESLRILPIDDLVALTSVAIDRTGDGVYEETWTAATDFVLEPPNAPTDGKPWETIKVRRQRGRYFPRWIEQSVKVTGQFGWPAVPEDVKFAVALIATRYMLRTRQAPFGVVMFYAEGSASGAGRIARVDPDIAPVIEKYTRRRPFL